MSTTPQTEKTIRDTILNEWDGRASIICIRTPSSKESVSLSRPNFRYALTHHAGAVFIFIGSNARKTYNSFYRASVREKAHQYGYTGRKVGQNTLVMFPHGRTVTEKELNSIDETHRKICDALGIQIVASHKSKPPRPKVSAAKKAAAAAAKK